MDTYSVFLSVLLLFGNFHASDCTVTHEDDIHNCEKTFTISWLYTDAADMSTVVWEFIKSGSASQTIMIQTQGSNASVLGGFNVLHISNGIVNITNPTLAANNGTYQITVTYSTSATAAVDAVNVFEYVSPTGLRYSNTSSGNNITFTCAATSFGGPVPATLYIKVGQVDRNSITATVIKDAEDVQCCLDGDAANVCLGEKKCVYAQHKSNTTTSDGSAKQILCSIAISFASSVIIGGIILIAYGPIGNVVAWNLTRFDVAAIVYGIVVGFYSVIVGAITVDKNGDCSTCNHNNGLAIASIVLGCIGIAVVTVLLAIRVGWCGKHLTCLNTVLPVCKDTDTRGPPDGKSDHPASKEKHREVKLLTHKEQTQQHHKETVVNKGKPSGEKHEEPSKGQPRPLPVPTGNNRDDTGSAGAVSRQDVVLDRRPMPDIPSDRHKRGLSANYSDDRDKPLDDNILHTLPVVKKPKNALDPMNDEGKSKNSDDQPKKKKKKKDRDTSRSGEMEDDIDSHGKVLAF